MIQINTAVDIRRPPEEVFAYVADIRNNPRWQPVLRVEDVPVARASAGMRFRQWFQLLGRSYEARYEVTDCVPPRRIAFRYASSPFSSEGAYTFEPVPAGTRFGVAGVVNLHGLMRLSEGLLTGTVRDEIRESAEKLKRLLEAPDAILVRSGAADAGRG
jgi:uncharacterized protein YndB with AHSA1/START domain